MRPHLTQFERAWTDAAWGAIFPAPPSQVGGHERPHLAHGIDQLGPGQYLDGVLQIIPFEQMFGLRLTLWVIALAPLFALRKLATVASLDLEDRMRLMEILYTSKSYLVRQMATGFKAVATLLIAQSPVIRKQMHTPLRTDEGEALVTIRTSQTRVKGTKASSTRSASNEHAAE